MKNLYSFIRTVRSAPNLTDVRPTNTLCLFDLHQKFQITIQSQPDVAEQLVQSRRAKREAAVMLHAAHLTVDMIESHWVPSKPGAFFSHVEKEILIYLVTNTWGLTINLLRPPILRPKQLLKPLDAIREINGLNVEQLEILVKHYAFGLRGDFLREKGPQWATEQLSEAEKQKKKMR